MLRFLIFILLLFITIVSCGGYWMYKYQLTAPLTLYEELPYTISPNMNLREIAMDLMDKEVINYPTTLAWVYLARWQKKAHLIKVGEYLIPVGTTPQQLLHIFVTGKTLQYSLMILEGWNFRKMLAAIKKHPQIIQTLKTKNFQEIMAQLGWANQHPEGRFYPDTYLFPRETTDVEFLQRAYRTMTKELNKVWKQRATNLPFDTAYEALILASIIEKETGLAAERPQIASVFVQRLKKGMLLQTDPTVIYALGTKYNGNIRKKDLKVDNPYNTYRYKGLPPTPIALPGRAALIAAVNPMENDESLFFVAKGDGSHYFSKTYKEHECAVIQYQLKKSSRRYRSFCNKRPNCQACSS
ncbi:MAG: endolytic transglycosylase MltG [Thiomargarita sp.]|nr:endolytic transglycosylase MltG [Thiomargarita sp.]